VSTVQKYVHYPYGVNIANVYGMSTITMVVDLFTASEVQIVTAAGKPVDLSTLVDFDLGSILNNPTADDLVLTQVDTETDWFGKLFSGIGQIFTYLIIGGVVVLAIVIVPKLIPMFKRK